MVHAQCERIVAIDRADREPAWYAIDDDAAPIAAFIDGFDAGYRAAPVESEQVCEIVRRAIRQAQHELARGAVAATAAAELARRLAVRRDERRVEAAQARISGCAGDARDRQRSLGQQLLREQQAPRRRDIERTRAELVREHATQVALADADARSELRQRTFVERTLLDQAQRTGDEIALRMYVGALSLLLDIDVDIIERLLGEQYKGKEKLLDANKQALHLGRDYVREYLAHPLGLRVKHADGVGDRIFVDGNSAAALGCVYGGATVCAWYPITPSSSLAEAFQKYCMKYRVDAETGANRFAIVQAEDEIASIGMSRTALYSS